MYVPKICNFYNGNRLRMLKFDVATT
jgi:hypothetical protein